MPRPHNPLSEHYPLPRRRRRIDWLRVALTVAIIAAAWAMVLGMIEVGS